MASTTYVDFTTPAISAAWLNDVNTLTYNLDLTQSFVDNTVGWAEKLNFVKPEWWIAEGLSETAGLQAAIDFACANDRGVLLSRVYTAASTLNLPTSGDGCLIMGANRNCGIKYTALTGTLFNAVSTRGFKLAGLTLAGPGSSNNTTAVTCSPVSAASGTYYNGFTHLTIEGFQTGMNISGLVGADFNDIHIGLAKSGVFTGTDQEACPLIGLNIGTTVLACTFSALTIFAKQRCLQQTTQAQLSEGLYFTRCTFDLSFNLGNNVNQSCIYLESGQDIAFTTCWFTNTQKFGSTVGPYSDALIRVTHNPGAISAPLVSLKFTNCTAFGHGITLNYGSNPLLTSELKFEGNLFRLYPNLGNWSITGSVGGVTVTSNQIRVIGDSINIAGTDYYNIVGRPFEMTSVKGFKVSDNLLTSALPLNTVPSYMRFISCSQGSADDNEFPPQLALTSASDIIINTCTDVVVRGQQQGSGRQLTTTIPVALYNSGNTLLGTIVTGLTKPRMALIEVDLSSASVSAAGTLVINGIITDGSHIIQVATTGIQQIRKSVVALVSGSINLSFNSGIALTTNASFSIFKLTYI